MFKSLSGCPIIAHQAPHPLIDGQSEPVESREKEDDGFLRVGLADEGSQAVRPGHTTGRGVAGQVRSAEANHHQDQPGQGGELLGEEGIPQPGRKGLCSTI